MNLMFVECRLVSPRTRFFFIKLPSIECVSISLKFRWSFVDIHKVRELFCKIAIYGLRLISPKVEGFFAKFTSPDVHVSVARKLVCGSHHTCQCCGICSV